MDRTTYRPTDPTFVVSQPKGNGALTAVKTVAGIAVAGTALYLVWKFVIPLLKGVGDILGKVGDVAGTVVDAAGTVVDTGVQEAKLLLGLPASVWSVFAGTSAKWKPNPQWTPQFIAQHMGDLSWLNVGEVVATWSAVCVAKNNGQTAGPDFIAKWFAEQQGEAAIPVLRQAIMFFFQWNSPSQGVHDGTPLDMKEAGDIGKRSNGKPMDKLYRLTATMTEAGPPPRAENHVTSGYMVMFLWDKMFPPAVQQPSGSAYVGGRAIGGILGSRTGFLGR